MMLRNNKVLLGKRHVDPKKADSELHSGGTWTMPGGKLEFGESFEEGAIREVMEETGMILINPRVICVNNDLNEHAHFVTIGLFSEDFKGGPNVIEPDEITEWDWFTLDNLTKNVFFPSLKLLENYHKKQFYIKDN